MAILKELIQKVKGSPLGFNMDEAMIGEHQFAFGEGPEGRYPFRFDITWGPEDLTEWLNPNSGGFLSHPFSGTVTAGALCDHAPCEGRMELRYFKDYTIRYDFRFRAHDKTYRFLGEKVNIKPWNLPFSHTTCFGTVVEEETGKLVSRSITHFKVSMSFSFLSSLRLT